jgi:HAD superfamily hydrolase (TIGR01509 family)
MSIRGAVFDLDGTITDNMAFHVEAFAVFAERHGLPPLDLTMRARLDGKRNRDIFPILFERELSEDALARYSDEKEALYRELSRGRLAPLPGLVRLLDALDARGAKIAIATSAPAANVPHTLGQLGLEARLTRVARSDQVGRGKPAPDVFLAAAELIGVAAADCVAFEDAPLGVVAARAAGMQCVAITTSFSLEGLIAHAAAPDFAVADFDEYLAGPGAWLAEPKAGFAP